MILLQFRKTEMNKAVEKSPQPLLRPWGMELRAKPIKRVWVWLVSKAIQVCSLLLMRGIMRSTEILAETWLSCCNFIPCNSKMPLFILIIFLHMADSKFLLLYFYDSLIY